MIIIEWKLSRSNNNTIEQNTEKSPGDLRRHVAIQTPVKHHQLTLA